MGLREGRSFCRICQAAPDATAKFDVVPDDVAAELAEIARQPRRCAGGHISNGKHFTHVLSSRRMRDVYNTIGMFLPSTRRRTAYNPAYLHPDDLVQYGMKNGDRIQIASDHGQVVAIVEADPSVRRGVVSMAHGWGKLPGESTDAALHGSSVNMLISTDSNVEPINGMPRMSGIPVNIARANVGEH
jgi:anaerobic selenocysteine-containing dehydrogenase